MTTTPALSEWNRLRHDHDLGLAALHANFTTHAFTRNWHDYYVIGLVEAGAQSFWCRRATYTTPGGGLILLNPGEVHTGESATRTGFHYRALYPTLDHVAQAQAKLRLKGDLPLFPNVRVDDGVLSAQVLAMHHALESGASPLERETRWLDLLTMLFTRYGDGRPALPPVGCEPQAIARVRAYIEAHYADRVTLEQLAAHVHLSPYHLVRVFRQACGVLPHSYLESVRIRHAQRLLLAGLPLAEVAYATGFSSQSHFTCRFRRTIGVKPGHFRQERARL